jgi:hypothetical protein
MPYREKACMRRYDVSSYVIKESKKKEYTVSSNVMAFLAVFHRNGATVLSRYQCCTFGLRRRVDKKVGPKVSDERTLYSTGDLLYAISPSAFSHIRGIISVS